MKKIISRWHSEGAKKQLDALKTDIGEPIVFAPAKGGIAIWDTQTLKNKQWSFLTAAGKTIKKKNLFSEIIIRDEAIIHKCPSLHKDFLYASIKIDIEPEQLPIVLAVSGSVNYDALKQIFNSSLCSYGSKHCNSDIMHRTTCWKCAAERCTQNKSLWKNGH